MIIRTSLAPTSPVAHRIIIVTEQRFSLYFLFLVINIFHGMPSYLLFQVMYDGMLARDFAEEWESHSRKATELSSHLRESRDLTAILENEIVHLRGEIDAEKKRTETVKMEAIAMIDRCSHVVKRMDDLQAATEAREDGSNKVIIDLKIKENPPQKMN